MIDFDTRTSQLDDLLGVGRNFDMVGRVLRVGGRQAKLWVVNGYAEDSLIERMIGRLLAIGSLNGIADLPTSFPPISPYRTRLWKPRCRKCWWAFSQARHCLL